MHIFHPGVHRFPWKQRIGQENEESEAGMGSFLDVGDEGQGRGPEVSGAPCIPSAKTYRPADHPLDNASRRPAADRRGTGVRDGVQVVEQRRNQDPIPSLPSNP